MNFASDFVSKILLGSLLGTLLTAWFTNRRSKRDLCIQVYERWISNPLYQSRSEVLKQLKSFFDLPLPPGYKFDNKKTKLSELKFLSKKHHNYQPVLSEDFIDQFVQVIIFFVDLSKLMRKGLVDINLSQEIFKDTIMPWYKYLEKIEFDLIEEAEFSLVHSQINLLKPTLQALKADLS